MSDEGSPRPMEEEPLEAANGAQDAGRSPSRERSASPARSKSRSGSPARERSRSRSPIAAGRDISPERSPVVCWPSCKPVTSLCVVSSLHRLLKLLFYVMQRARSRSISKSRSPVRSRERSRSRHRFRSRSRSRDRSRSRSR